MPDNNSQGAAVNLPALQEANFIPAPLEAVISDVPLPYSLYIKVAGQLVLFRARGDLLSEARFQALLNSRIDSMFIPKTEWEHFLEETEKGAEAMISDPQNALASEKAITRLRSLLVVYEKNLETQKQLQRATFAKLRELGFRMSEGIYRNPELGSRLLRRYTNPNLYFANHSINVAIYGTAVAHKMRIPLEEAKLLTFSCLMHNVGNIYLPHAILYKPGPLTPEEKTVARKHPSHGAKLLEQCNAPKEVVMTAKQHHERADGTGYPSGITGSATSLFARIVHIVDCYDAMTSHKPYEGPISPKVAIDQMMGDTKRFDPHILHLVGGGQ